MSYDGIDQYDKVYVSKVFTDTETPENVLKMPNVEYGGTGFFFDTAKPLPDEVEHHKPDYDLYKEFVSFQVEAGRMSKSDASQFLDYSIGFSTRGCIRGCSFCVNRNYRKCLVHSPVSEFLDDTRKYIYLLDDNVLACKDWKRIFEELNATGKRFRFHQGMDERLLTDEKCDVIFKSNWIGDFIFAFDNIADRDLIVKKLQMIRRHTDSQHVKFYCFCAYNHDRPEVYDDGFWVKDIGDLFERIAILSSFNCLPYIMRYKDWKISPYKDVYIEVARWVNQPAYFRKKSFREFCMMPSNNKITKVRFERFCKDLPEISQRYFDIKYGDAYDTSPSSFMGRR